MRKMINRKRLIIKQIQPNKKGKEQKTSLRDGKKTNKKYFFSRKFLLILQLEKLNKQLMSIDKNLLIMPDETAKFE